MITTTITTTITDLVATKMDTQEEVAHLENRALTLATNMTIEACMMTAMSTIATKGDGDTRTTIIGVADESTATAMTRDPNLHLEAIITAAAPTALHEKPASLATPSSLKVYRSVYRRMRLVPYWSKQSNPAAKHWETVSGHQIGN
jgi:hypothetical protein